MSKASRYILAFGILGSSFCRCQCALDRNHVHGQYTNKKFLYKVLLPPNIEACTGPAPSPQHGFAIYSQTPEKTELWVNADFDVLGLRSPDALASETARTLSANYHALFVTQRFATTLAGLPAMEIIMRGESPDDAVHYVRFLEAVRSISDQHPEIVYTIGLQASSKVPVSDVIFSHLVSSFHLVNR